MHGQAEPGPSERGVNGCCPDGGVRGLLGRVQPVDQVLGYGTQVVTQTVDTPDGQLEYWRAVTVYATSYSPCRSGVERCYYISILFY